MNVMFGNSALVPWLLLAAVPLLLHLFARSRPPAYLFSSTTFIARLKREATRIKRPQDWMLLALRTLLFLALAGVFLQPVLFSRRHPAGRFERRNLVLIVDATASMAYADGSQSRFVAACAEASSALAGLAARDLANVVWLKHAPEAVLPELSGNTAYLRGALRQARVTAGAGDPARALALAVAMLSDVEGRRELCIVSDFQATGWEAFRAELPAGIDLTVVRVGRADGENGAVTSLTFEPSHPIVGEDLTVYCEVANYSPLPRRRTVFLETGDSRLSASVLVPAWGTAVAALPCRFPRAGVIPIAATLDEDAFPPDNRRVTLAHVDPHARIGLLANDAPTATAWKRATEALGWTRVESLTTADLEGGRAWDALLLAGWDGTAAMDVARRAASGTLVTIFPHPTFSLATWWRMVGAVPPPALAAAGPPSLDESPTPMRVRAGSTVHPALALLEAAGIVQPVRAGFRTRYRIAAASLPPCDTLLAFEDGIPALVQARGLPLYLWNMPLAPTATDWPKQTEFVLFMGELLHAHRNARVSSAPSETHPGETLRFTPDRPLAADAVSLSRDGGNALPVTELFREGVVEWHSEPAEQPGLYAWREGGETVRFDAVNVPVSESDLRTMDPRRVSESHTAIVHGGGQLKALHEGRALWPWLLGACLGLALLESCVVWWSEWR